MSTSSASASPAKKQHLAALRAFFDALVLRHVVLLNPAASVRGERYSVVDGKTSEIAVEQARKLLASIAIARPLKTAEGESGAQLLMVGLRDRAIVAILIYTAARIAGHRQAAGARLIMGVMFDCEILNRL